MCENFIVAGGGSLAVASRRSNMRSKTMTMRTIMAVLFFAIAGVASAQEPQNPPVDQQVPAQVPPPPPPAVVFVPYAVPYVVYVPFPIAADSHHRPARAVAPPSPSQGIFAGAPATGI